LLSHEILAKIIQAAHERRPWIILLTDGLHYLEARQAGGIAASQPSVQHMQIISVLFGRLTGISLFTRYIEISGIRHTGGE
jgi:hypothetical protein